jgi:hypothetical protein
MPACGYVRVRGCVGVHVCFWACAHACALALLCSCTRACAHCPIWGNAGRRPAGGRSLAWARHLWIGGQPEAGRQGHSREGRSARAQAPPRAAAARATLPGLWRTRACKSWAVSRPGAHDVGVGAAGRQGLQARRERVPAPATAQSGLKLYNAPASMAGAAPLAPGAPNTAWVLACCAGASARQRAALEALTTAVGRQA